MVKISYCVKCNKAYRFHLKKKWICRECKELFEDVEVQRTKYFLIQFPLLMIGLIVIFYSVFMLSQVPARIAEPIGYFIFGFSILLFALAFQFLDNKQMEQQGVILGKRKFTDLELAERADERFKPRIKGAKKSKIDKLEERSKEMTAEELFIQPNKPKVIKKKPKHKEKEEKTEQPVKTTKIKSIFPTKPEKKPARKIRRPL